MANTKKVYTIEIDGVSQSVAKVDDLRVEIEKLNQEFEQNSKEVDKNKEKTEEQAIALEDFGGVAGDVSGQLTQLRGAVDKLGKQFSTLKGAVKGTGLLVLVGLITSVGSALADGRKATREFQIAFQQFANAAKLIGNRLIDTFGSLFASLNDKYLGLQLRLAELPEFLGGSEDAAAKLRTEIANNEKQIKSISNIWDGWTDAIGENNDAIREKLELEDELVKVQAQRQLELAKLTNEEEILAIQAEDSTISLRNQSAALDELIKKQQQRLNFNKESARLEQELILKNIEIKLRNLNLEEKFTKQQIESLKFLNNKTVADALSNEEIQALTENTLKLRDAELQLSLFSEQNSKIRRQNIQDEKEIELDFAIDTFENQKAINERIINDEETVFAEKQRILDETTALADKAFKKQGEILQEFTDKEINLQELVDEKDATALAEKIKGYELSEILENRLREVIQERRNVVQDLAETRKEVSNTEIERIRKVEEAEQDLLLFQEEQKVKLAIGEEERRKREIEAITFRYTIEQQRIKENEKDKELASQKITLLEEKEKAELLEINKKYDEDLKAQKKAQLEEIKQLGAEFIQASLEFVNTIIDESIERRQQQLDEATERVSEAENKLEESRARAEELNQAIKDSDGAKREFLIDQISKEEKAEKRLSRAKEKAQKDELKRAAELEKEKKKQAKLQFTVDLAEALSSGALAIARVIAATAFDPTGALRTIQIGLISATTALQVATIASQSKKFAKGGFTGDGYGSPDETGYKPAGIVHENEYVVPERILKSNEGKDLVNRLESMRLNKFANGGFTSPNFAQATVDLQQNNLISKIEVLTMETRKINSAPVNVVATEVANVNSRVANIREKATI